MKSYAGDYIDLAREELSSSSPNPPVLIQCFLKILEALTTMLHRETAVIHHERDSMCKCTDYIMEHMSDIVELEDTIQAVLQHQIITDPNACWLTRTVHKYRLLFHMSERGAGFGTQHPGGYHTYTPRWRHNI